MRTGDSSEQIALNYVNQKAFLPPKENSAERQRLKEIHEQAKKAYEDIVATGGIDSHEAVQARSALEEAGRNYLNYHDQHATKVLPSEYGIDGDF